MQIWYFIKFLGRLCIWLAQKIVGWFVLGRSCSGCEERGAFVNCLLHHDILSCGITKKDYEVDND